MSIAQNPLMGPMRKSMGNFTTMNYNGQNIIRSKAFQPNIKKTAARRAQQLKFALLAQAKSAFGGIIELGFVEYNRGRSAHNGFFKENMKTAFDLSGELPVIDYSKLVISKGSLPVLRVTGGEAGDDGLTIRYETCQWLPRVSTEDIIVAFAKGSDGQLFMGRQVRGNAETGTLFIPDSDQAKTEIDCCYVFAMSADGKKSSNSVYVKLA